MNLSWLEKAFLAAVLLVAGGGILVALHALGFDIPLLADRAPSAEPLLGEDTGYEAPPGIPEEEAEDGLLAELVKDEDEGWIEGAAIGERRGPLAGADSSSMGEDPETAGSGDGLPEDGDGKAKRDPLIDELKAKTDLADPGQLMAFLMATFTPMGTKLGQEDLEFLFAAIEAQEDWGIRNLIFAHLERVGGAEVTSGVLEFLANEKNPASLSRALATLGAQNDTAAVEGLVAFLAETDNGRLREAAFRNLLKTKNGEAADSLLQVLDAAQTPQLKRYALAALSQLGGERGAEAVVAYAGSTDPYERAIGQKSLRDLKDPAAVPALATALETSADPYLRVQVVRSMGKIGDSSAVAPVSNAALYDDNRGVRAAAIGTLASIGRVEAYPALQTIAETDPNKGIRKAATKAIQTIAAKEARRAARPPKPPKRK